MRAHAPEIQLNESPPGNSIAKCVAVTRGGVQIDALDPTEIHRVWRYELQQDRRPSPLADPDRVTRRDRIDRCKFRELLPKRRIALEHSAFGNRKDMGQYRIEVGVGCIEINVWHIVALII